MPKSRAEEILDQIRELVNSGYLPDDTLRDELARQLGVPEELHTNPEVGRIAAIGDKNPDDLQPHEVQSLCGEVLRHIRNMQGKG